ncbi:oxalate/formate antiporter [Paraburkholderia steynii]|uniref:Oxalate/formate antiporter n=1 Tax=Paraburkholderia steynii TaxID=1245441 RepID=A0A7Z7BB09_9BURK|nr:oxalate/formate MFS antiporter [Paraburkholderia steynii]SDI50662.1 oxalate/formate antiporter [Paraburkholderia steynii]
MKSIGGDNGQKPRCGSQKGSLTRWVQLALGMTAMLAISSPQYVWTLFVSPIRSELKASLSALQVTIALFSVFQAGLGPIYGWIAVRMSTRWLGVAGGLLVGLSWVISGYAASVPALYVSYGAMAGIGTGLVYVAVIELMILWFPDRRGLAVGMAAGSYGFGAIITTFPIAFSIGASGYRSTLVTFGVGLAAIISLASLWMRRPTQKEALEFGPSIESGGRALVGATTRQMVRTPAFWWMYVAMAMMATGGLMAISQLSAFAKDFGITDGVRVFGMAALPLAMTIDRIANGITRPFFGWLSDLIGRENTMCAAFVLEGIAITLLLTFGRDPLTFTVLTGMVFFGWGEIYSLFPSLQADVFGTAHAAKNFGVLLTATAVGSILGGPMAAAVYETTRSWDFVFYAVIGLDLCAAFIVMFIIKPMLRNAGAVILNAGET